MFKIPSTRTETLKTEKQELPNRTAKENADKENTPKTNNDTRRQNKCRVKKENHDRKENYIIITGKP